MTQTDRQVPEQPDEPEAKGVIVPCASCGYNLRGLAANACCPACGAAAGAFQPKPRLKRCDPVWVETLAQGTNWVLAGILASILATLVAVGIVVTTQDLSQVRQILLPPVLVVFVGYWKLTTPEPGQRDTESSTARLIARYGWSVLFTLGELVSLVERTMCLSPLWWALIIGLALASIVVPIAAFTYGRGLALRVPDEDLAVQTDTVMWGFGLATSLSWIVVMCCFSQMTVDHVLVGDGDRMITTITFRSDAVSFSALITLMARFALVAAIIFYAWTFRLLLDYRRAFLAAAKQAQANATAPSSAPPITGPPPA